MEFSRQAFIEKVLEKVIAFLDDPRQRKADLLIMFWRWDSEKVKKIPAQTQVREYEL